MRTHVAPTQYRSDETPAATRAKVSRRAALGLLMSASGAALLAACGPAAPAAPAPAAAKPAEAPKPAAQPIKKGGVIRWGQVGDVTTTDSISWSPVSNPTLGQVAEMLTDYDDDLKVIPRLAESWELSTDNTKIKLNLRKGVTWHSGREFTSEDVEYNLLRARDPKVTAASVVAPGSAWWTSWEKPDKHTIILQSDKPRPGVFDFLQYFRQADKESTEGPDRQKVVGTGPFMWKEWVPGDRITLVKNPNYWETDHPYVDGKEIRIFRDQQSMVAALEAGALDVADLIPIPDAVRLQTDSRYKLYVNHDLGQFFYAVVNVGKAPLDDKLLRQAISYAIDRKRFTDTVMKGFAGEPRALPWAKSSPAFDPEKNKAYTFDLEKAKSLLAQSGLSNVEFDIAWSLAGYQAEYQALATIIQSDLAKIGIKTTLKPTDPPAFTTAGNGLQPPYSGMRLSAGAFCQLAEAGSEFALSRTFGYASNIGGFYDDKWTQMATSVAVEPDPAKRKQMYAQINDYMLDQVWSMTICAYTNVTALRPNVMDFKYFLSTLTGDRNTWLA